MEWFLIVLLGAGIGAVIGVLAQGIHMPPIICVLVGIVGAIAGAALDRITGFAAAGPWTYYLAAGIVALGFLAGAVLGFNITREEKRV